jgi:hypothetical protein
VEPLFAGELELTLLWLLVLFSRKTTIPSSKKIY